MRSSTILVSLALSLSATFAYGWGDTGHKTINATAAGLMESGGAAFFQANRDNLATLSTVPDVEWKHSNYDQEKPYHFFQWDNYSASRCAAALGMDFAHLLAILGGEFVQTNGPAPWRVGQIYGRLVEALKAGQYVQALQMAGVLGHYVGDLSQPMHNSSDFDGQSIGRRGIHLYYEVTLVDRLNNSTLRDGVLNAGGPLRQQLDAVAIDTSAADQGAESVRQLTIVEGRTSFNDLSGLLADFHGDSSDDQALSDTLNERLGIGAATFAKVLDAAVTASGIDPSSLPTRPLTVKAPVWFPLN